MGKKELDLMTRKKIIRAYAKRYQKATSKKEKSEILDEFLSVIDYNRSYAAWLLRHAGRKVRIRTPQGVRVIVVADPHLKIRRRRSRTYDREVFLALRKIWVLLDYPCSLKLKAILPEVLPKLEAYGELVLTEEVRQKLLRISRATIDRLLASERRRLKLKPRARTKPGTLLKKQIPIRTHAGWQEGVPGFLEMDLISHDGGLAKGDFAWTLVLTDIETQWTELVPVKNRAQVWTFQALQEALQRFPFPIRGLDCDNDGAFINRHLVEWCQEEGILLTRSRPYWKNDNCHVEQKNWSVGRRYLGYGRYDTEEALRVLRELGVWVSLYVNHFQPSVKLLRKVREGAKVRRIYGEPKTPYQRVLEHPEVSEEIKEELRRRYEGLNPAELYRKIRRLQRKLFMLATPVQGVVQDEQIFS